MSKHTPGPWKIDAPTPEGHRPIHESTEAGYLIATVWADDSGKQEADARLIAAAPRLLEACRTLIRICSKRDGTLYEYEDWIQAFIEDGSSITECVRLAQAAIAEAKAQ